MKPIPISIQLYSVRDIAKANFPAVLEKIADIGYVGVEFAGLHGMTPAEVKKVLDRVGLVASSSHGAFPSKENLKEIAETAKTLGYKRHISGFGPADMETQEKALACAAKLKDAAALFKGTGLTFGIHNHWWEFDKKFDGKYPEDILLSGSPDLFAELDTYWSTLGGADTPAYIKSLGARAPLLHIKDGPLVKDQKHTAVGKGKMDWAKVIGAAHASCEWLVVELDSCDTDMMTAVADSYKFLTSKGYAKGKK